MYSISVVMATLNSAGTLGKALASIRRQQYEQKRIEIIAADGGSRDATLQIVSKYGGTAIAEHSGSPEAAKAVALQHAHNDIILEIDDDNILPHRGWLAKMVSLFNKEPDITGCYTWHYAHRRSDKPLNRYFALLGANDPVAWFLGRADRQSYFKTHWDLAGKVKDKGSYFLVEFSPENLPTVGANGFLIKRKLLMKAQVDAKHFFHIDVNLDLVRQGYNKYAVVKNDIVHISGDSFERFFAKRKKYMENLYLKDLPKRRYLLYDKKRDQKKIVYYSLYSLTIVKPVWDAVKGYAKIHDPAWFFHPLVCFLMFWIYFLSVINWQSWHYLGLIKKKLKKF